MGYDKHQAKHEFTRWSESYDQSILQRLLFGPSHRAIIARIQSEYGKHPIQILDIGCGTGIFAERIREALPKAQVIGVDLVDGMLRKGTERWQRHADAVFPVQADSERLPFAWGSFDVVTCANSFHHYPHQQRAILEMKRVLKPRGRLMLVDGYRDRPWGWWVYDVCVATVEGAVHHASARQISTMCGEAGFESTAQAVHRGIAPFLLTEAITPESNKTFVSHREAASLAR